MTVETNDTVERYTVSGVGPYAFSFRVFDEDEITVTAISAGLVPMPLTITTDYTVSGVDGEDGGTVTLVSGTATTYAGYTLDIRSNTAEYQPTSIRNQGRFLPEIHEDAFDRMSRQIQDLSRKTRASLRYPDDEIADAVAPAVASRKGRYLFSNVVTGAWEWVTSIATTALSQTIFDQYQADSQPYKRTAAEVAASVTPVNYAIPNHDVVGYVIVERYGNNSTPGTTDMTSAVQDAVDVGLAAECDVAVTTMCRLTSSINIDREVDGANYDAHFTIRGYGGGFYVTSALSMFSSTIAFSTAPVSQLVRWKDIRFEASGTGFDAYVLNDARFLRSEFVGCDFVKIKAMYAPTVHTQSLYFFHCNMRRWTGIFYRSLNVNFDTKFHGCLAEAGDQFARMAFPVGCALHQNTIEGMSGAAVTAWGSQALSVVGNYFEQNDVDLDFRQVASEANYGITVHGNYFSHDLGAYSPSSQYSVRWGDTNFSQSEGNYFTDYGHEFNHVNRPRVADFALDGVSNAAGTQYIPAANLPAFSARSAADQSITTSTFTKITFGTEDYDTNANFASSTFTPTVQGIYAFDGTVHVTGTSVTRVAIALYKNGAEAQRLHDATFGAQSAYTASVAGSVWMNGSTDTMELWVFVIATSPVVEFVSAAETSRFAASLVRNS